ncbi:MAG: dihydropyrimidinase [Bdellovibrionales bacterium RIFOXYC1_FULL_54_43]|nr:MAG: dihydropyrimidinase [Bdellovibrionales bacterium RIFOXYC1_FULL_54_43]OFZ83728.1 MAG: dihydropyrimidinase [Bdellovibrionales bacterium RIFOXYD1_FULL_55_31]
MARDSALNDLLITNGMVVTADKKVRADIHVLGEKIAKIAPALSRKLPANPARRVIDAKGCFVFPGGIDAHTHMELPLKETSSSDTFESGTLAALHGGTTTILDFANQVRGGTLKGALDEWHAKARGKAACDYGFHVSVTDFNERTRREIRTCMDQGVTSFKTFTAYKGSLMIDDRQMIEVMKEVRDAGGIVLTHAENGDLIDHLIERFRAEGHYEPRYHALSRPPLAEAEAVSRIIDLANFANCPLYIVHLSSGAGLKRALGARPGRAPVFLETCIQYLLLNESAYSKPGFEGAKYVLSPPLRGRGDQKALWAGLASDAVSVVATDHCPFMMAQRELGRKDFSRIPNGIPGVEHRMELLYSEGVAKGRISLEKFVELTSSRAAKIFGLYPRKGAFRPGADADIVIFDPKVRHVISSRTHHMKCDYSVYEGHRLQGKCRTIILRGQVAVDNGIARVGRGFGRFLSREKFRRDFRT